MDLDDYKTLKLKDEVIEVKDLSLNLGTANRRNVSIIESVRRNLRFEIAFALLFLIFDCCMFVFFSDIFYLRIFTVVLLVFSCCFIYYISKLLRYINTKYRLDDPIKDQLAQHIHILSGFIRVYFQLTTVMIPLILVMALTAVYLDQSQSVDFAILFSSQNVALYFGISIAWCFIMYFFTWWYMKKLYGNHLDNLTQQLEALQGE